MNNYGKRSEQIKFIVVHYTGSTGASASNIKKYFDRKPNVSSNYIVDDDAVIEYLNPALFYAFHCGGLKTSNNGAYNRNSIGIDLCCDKIDRTSKKASDRDWFIPEKTVCNAVELIQKLCKVYNIKRIVRHYDVTGKTCPRPFVGDDMNSYYGKSGNDVWRAVRGLCLQPEVLR